eukprot:6393941-Amphidinium_carterae.1
MERLWGSMVLRHLRSQLPPMTVNQFAQPGRQPQEGLLLLRCLLSQADLLRALVAILKVDVRKPFDSLRHSAIMSMLQAKGVAPWLQRALLTSLRHRRAHMHSPAGLLTFSLEQGIPQGRPDSPELFMQTVSHYLAPLFQRWAEEDGTPLALR